MSSTGVVITELAQPIEALPARRVSSAQAHNGTQKAIAHSAGTFFGGGPGKHTSLHHNSMVDMSVSVVPSTPSRTLPACGKHWMPRAGPQPSLNSKLTTRHWRRRER